MYEYEKNPVLVVDGIDEDSKSILSNFYNIYGLYEYDSSKTYTIAIRRLCEFTNKRKFSDFNYNDYLKIKNNRAKAGIGENFTRMESFLKYLYAFELMSNPKGFEECYWNKEKILNDYEKLLSKKAAPKDAKKVKEYTPFLSFKEIDRIYSFISQVSDDDIKNMRLAFCFYAIFELGFDVTKLKRLTSNSYKNGIIVLGGNEYIVDDRYIPFLNQLMQNNKFKFSQINIDIDKLGKYVGIDNLTPKKINQARQQYSFCCPQCGEIALSFSNNWCVINGKILCNSCAEQLIENSNEDVKKNISSTELASYDIELTTETEKHKYYKIVKSFSEQRSQVSFPKNYEDINKFLKQIGDLGEKFVFEYELNYLKSQNSDYWEMVDGSYALDHTNGFDILSYTPKGEKVYIEVKTTAGDLNDEFYMSKNEYDKAQELIRQGAIYKLYRVYNILSENVSFKVFSSLDNSIFEFNDVLYKVNIKNDSEDKK